jgi:hypothetical protein
MRKAGEQTRKKKEAKEKRAEQSRANLGRQAGRQAGRHTVYMRHLGKGLNCIGKNTFWLSIP